MRERVRTFSSSGDPVVTKYFKTVDDDGLEVLKVSGTENLYDEIQSFKDSVDINTILSRYAAGDVGALSKYQGMYGDFSKAPTSLVEVIQMVNEGERAFMELPLSVREKFDNSLSKWLAEFGTELWSTKMGFDEALKPSVEEKEVEHIEQK